MSNKASKAFKIVLSFGLAAVFVYFAFRRVDWKAFWSGLAETRWIWLAVYAVATMLALAFRMERWTSLLRQLDPSTERMTAWDADNIGNLANLVIPGAGEFVRCGFVSSSRLPYDKAFGTMVCERALDVAAMAVLLIMALALKWDIFGSFFMEQVAGPAAQGSVLSLWWIAVIAALLAAASIWAVFRFRGSNRFCEKIVNTLKGLWSGFAIVSKVKNKFAFIACTAGIWLMYVVLSYCILKALPELSTLGFPDALLLASMGNLASVVPVPGGIGAYHYLVALALQSLYGTGWDMGILYATLNHESRAVLVVVLGAISWMCLTLRKKK